MNRKLLISLMLICLITLGLKFALLSVNDFQLDGEIKLGILSQAVTVHRDQYGIPYVFAETKPDLIRAQGFLIAQDRIFQVELYRALIAGRLASLIGESGLNSDIKMRVVSLMHNAKQHTQHLAPAERSYLQWYVDGYNAYLSTRASEFPIELSLLGIKPKPLEVADLVAIQHYVGFVHSKNYADEILDLNLREALGGSLANQLRPLNINPDREIAELFQGPVESPNNVRIRSNSNEQLASFATPVSIPEMGSNNWVTSAQKSVGNRPILSNDPHLDARILPGPWYPIGLFTKEIKAVGASIPGLPGILTGRTEHVSFGVTNAYGDSQDLYIEQVDTVNPQLYRDGQSFKKFASRTEIIYIKDDTMTGGLRKKEIKIRSTERGPVISDHAAFKVNAESPIVLRWAVSSVSSPKLGITQFLEAKTITDLDQAIQNIDVLYFNFVFSDIDGGIAHRSSGLIPIRQSGAIAKRTPRDDDWLKFIPKNEMPGQQNPAKGWLGTSNHDVIPDSYPYFYSTHFSPNYRYQRTKEFMSSHDQLNSEDHWSLILDVKNKHAEKLNPIFIKALRNDPSTHELADLLSNWDLNDDVEATGATLFHLTHEHLIRLILSDRLSSELLDRFLASRYYWLQRTDKLIVDGKSDLFDIPNTKKTETLEDLIILAAKKSTSVLKKELGSDMSKWKWGDFHTVTFVSPLKQRGFAKEWLGGGQHRVPGSGETLNRGQYSLNGGPYESQWFSSMRMVADMNDNDKIMAVVSGGNSARQFHPYFKSQLDSWVDETWIPWWLNKQKILENSQHQLTLTP